MDTHIGFINLQKSSYRVNRGKLLEILDKRGYPTHLIYVLKNCVVDDFYNFKMSTRKT
jgi:hypothetical protein